MPPVDACKKTIMFAHFFCALSIFVHKSFLQSPKPNNPGKKHILNLVCMVFYIGNSLLPIVLQLKFICNCCTCTEFYVGMSFLSIVILVKFMYYCSLCVVIRSKQFVVYFTVVGLYHTPGALQKSIHSYRIKYYCRYYTLEYVTSRFD